MKIKICGLVSCDDAKIVNEAEADFAGMVLFYEKSKRNIDIEKAKEIIAALEPAVKAVAVVVSPDIEEAKAICAAGFNYIQIHGRLDEETLDAITIPIIKAFNVADLKDLSEFDKYAEDDKVVGFVLDAALPGSGQQFDYSTVENLDRHGKMLILAGGLNSSNVLEAIAHVKPDGVDTSSGVEYEDGRSGKDRLKVLSFVHTVRGIS